MPVATLLPGFAAHYSDVGGCALRWYSGGAGPPVVLVHGLGGSAANWRAVAPLLAQRFRVLVPDLPGHARSAPLRRLDGLGTIADVVAELAAAEGATRAAYVGHSLGGDVVLHLAARRPDRVAGLVVISAGSLAASTRLGKAWLRTWGALRVSRIGGRYRLALSRRPRLRRLAFGGWGVDDPASLPPDAVLGLLDGCLHALDTRSAREALIADDSRLELDAVRCPAVVVWGARDRTTPLEHGFEYARRLRAPLRTLPATGHLAICERPAECAALIEELLDGIGKLDVLPGEVEPLGDSRRERLHA
jgi:pimeloyl-ACP methyl ester carboxylesterase